VSDKADRRERMKTLVSAVATASMSLLGAGVAHAAGPDYFQIPGKWWILLITIVVILNLLCCWRRRK